MADSSCGRRRRGVYAGLVPTRYRFDFFSYQIRYAILVPTTRSGHPLNASSHLSIVDQESITYGLSLVTMVVSGDILVP